MRELSGNDLDWFAARLSIATEDTRRLGGMPIQDVREYLRGVPDADSMSMSYATNGNQIFHIGDKSVEVGPMASNEEIKAAILNPFIPTANTKVTMAKSPLSGIGQKLGLLKHNAELDAQEISAKVDELDARRAAAKPKVMAGLEAQGQDIGELENFVSDLEKATNE